MVDMVGTRTISGVRKSKALNTGNQVKGIAMLPVCVCVCPGQSLLSQSRYVHQIFLTTSSLCD